MTNVRNVDGDYIADDPRDHCRHGVYVGGCGYDFMCGACEMGDPDPTPRQLRAELANVIRKTGVAWTEVLSNPALMRGEKPGEYAKIIKAFVEYELAHVEFDTNRVKVHHRIITEAARWADGPDDDQWCFKRHATEILNYGRTN